MKLYTKTGDDGTTGLYGNHRVGKDDLRVEAYGTVDETNSFIGLAAACCADQNVSAILQNIQDRLFEVGADLARPPQNETTTERAAGAIPPIGATQIEELEQHLDTLCAETEPLKHFVQPGGCELAARLHVARTTCRRAERLCVALGKREPIGEYIVRYLNRLSDLLFALARYANQQAGIDDTPWLGRKR